MKELFRQIKRPLDEGSFYLSLFSCLTLIDICAAIDSDNGEASGNKYKAWFMKYVAEKYRADFDFHLTGEDCYRFRCSMLHQCTGYQKKGKYARYVFLEPIGKPIKHCEVTSDRHLILDIRVFCNDILEGAEIWFQSVNSEKFEINYGKFMRRYPHGHMPYAVGVPVIA